MCSECLSEEVAKTYKANGEVFYTCESCGHSWIKELTPFDDTETQDCGFGR